MTGTGGTGGMMGTGGTGGMMGTGGTGGMMGTGGSGGTGGGNNPLCGNSIVEMGEQCDDGNMTSGDGCSDTCQVEAPLTCGNGNVDFQMGEQCDDGNTVAGDGCSDTCQIEAAASCGDGMLDIPNAEECDDGNNLPGDGCSPTCQLEMVGQSCGNTMLEGLEICDDGNTTNGDGCNPTCNLQGITSLFAGSPNQPGLVDGIGTAARLGGIGNMTVNTTHIYLGDETNHIIRRVDIATANVQSIAGDVVNGMGGYVDNPTGTNARFGSTEALTTDGTTIWIADGLNRVIRAMSTTPPFAVSTAVGSGTQGYADGNGSAVQFDGLRGLTFYKGFVYLLDPNQSTLRRFNPATGDVVTLAGAPGMMGQQDGFGAAARFISPRYMTADGSGLLYISDTNGNKIRIYNTVTTEVTTFAGDGTCGYIDATGTAARVHRPRGMTSDGTSIYWTEFNAHTIRQGVIATTAVSTLAGTPLACALTCNCMPNMPGSYVEATGAMAAFSNPWSMVFHFPSNSLFVLDGGNAVLRRIQ
jgi:cysteine-rich repeat protein